MKKTIVCLMMASFLALVSCAPAAGLETDPEVKLYDKFGYAVQELEYSERLPFLSASENLYTKRGIQNGSTIDEVRKAYEDVWGNMFYEETKKNSDGQETTTLNFKFGDVVLSFHGDEAGKVEYLFCYDLPYYRASDFAVAAGTILRHQKGEDVEADQYNAFLNALTSDEKAVFEKIMDHCDYQKYGRGDEFNAEVFAYAPEMISWLTSDELKTAQRVFEKFLEHDGIDI